MVARYKAKLLVKIEMNDYSFNATTTEVSLQGLRILCEGGVSKAVFSQYIQVTPGENISADIQVHVPGKRGLVSNFKCAASLMSVSRISQDSYDVGFKINRLDEDGYEVWQNYISTCR